MALTTKGRGDLSGNILWRQDTGAPYVPSLLHHRGLLYLATENGVLTVVDAATGKLVFKERLGGGFSASPVATREHIVLANEDGELFILAAGRTFELVQKVSFDSRIMASPVVVDGRLVVRTDQKVFVF
jgi:outer membrane protein assembly factor BamB